MTTVQLFLGLAFLFVLARMTGIDLSLSLPSFKRKEVNEEKIPLQEFKPDFTKPVTIKDEEDIINPL